MKTTPARKAVQTRMKNSTKAERSALAVKAAKKAWRTIRKERSDEEISDIYQKAWATRRKNLK